METDPTRVCELGDVDVVVVDEAGEALVVVETRAAVPTCGVRADLTDRGMEDHVDRANFGRSARLRRFKLRWRYVTVGCSLGSSTETAKERAAVENRVTTRAARWMCHRVGEHGRAVAEVATDLDGNWRTANDTVL